VVSCGADHVPEPLLEQLKPGGILIIPVGANQGRQALRVVKKSSKGERQRLADDQLDTHFPLAQPPGRGSMANTHHPATVTETPMTRLLPLIVYPSRTRTSLVTYPYPGGHAPPAEALEIIVTFFNQNARE